MISSRYHSHIIQITPTYYPFITHISSRYHLYITNLIQISPTYHSNIIRVSPTYGPNITRYFLQPHNLMKSRVLTQIWHTYCRKKTPLWNLIITPLLIIQILPKYYPEIIQKSSRNHPEIIQKSSRNRPDIIQSTSIFTTPQLGEKLSFHPDMARLLQEKTPLKF